MVLASQKCGAFFVVAGKYTVLARRTYFRNIEGGFR
jgi:hypothetical protein